MKYEYKNVEFLFLTREYEELEQFVDDCNSDMLGLVPMELYDEFVHQVTSFASRNGIKNMAAAVSKIIEIARKDARKSDYRPGESRPFFVCITRHNVI